MGRLPAPELDARQRAIKEEFTRVRGYWHSSWDETLQFAPELLAAYLEFSGVPWRGGTLEPKVKEFIYIAFDVAATHLYRTGLKIHVANALGYGATPEEITEVMEIAAVLGVHAVTTSAPLLAEELAARAESPARQSRQALGGAGGGVTRPRQARPWRAPRARHGRPPRRAASMPRRPHRRRSPPPPPGCRAAP
jgi:alkylhydroperoxidase/carboxymuconolactone decarboxylase family protein YurZ